MRAAIAILMAAVLLVPATAYAERDILVLPSTHIRLKLGDGVLDAPDGNLYWVPRDSHILLPDAWIKLDDELLRLEEAETRLTAENASLRKTAEAWRPSWVTLALGLGTGIALGMYIQSKL